MRLPSWPTVLGGRDFSPGSAPRNEGEGLGSPAHRELTICRQHHLGRVWSPAGHLGRCVSPPPRKALPGGTTALPWETWIWVRGSEGGGWGARKKEEEREGNKTNQYPSLQMWFHPKFPKYIKKN